METKKPTKNKIAVVVIGVESTGTRLATEILCKNGFWGDYGHGQRFDDYYANDKRLEQKDLPGDIERIVVRRSLPHKQEMPEMVGIFNFLSVQGFEEIKLVITHRDRIYRNKSQVLRGHCKTEEEAQDRSMLSQVYLLEVVKPLFFKEQIYKVHYEALVRDPMGGQIDLIDFANGKEPLNFVEIKDGDAKYKV